MIWSYVIMTEYKQNVYKTIFLITLTVRKKKWQERGAQFTARSNAFETSNKRAKRVFEDTTRFKEFEVKVSVDNFDFLASDGKTTGNVGFCSLISILELRLLLLVHFYGKCLQLYLGVVSVSKIRSSQRIILILRHIHRKEFRRICWKHGTLLKLNTATDALITICR